MSETNNSYYQLPGSLIQHHNTSMQPILSESPTSLTTDTNMEYPVLMLTQQPDSHHFNERRIVLNETIKVGRSVARARPSDVNAIFDCKVLSRNHAVFWYENGKVLLRDTKSSNGTFVNSQLLSKGTEDSQPREIYSGDIIQFGVEVVENTTTHGCIIAQVSIFMSDGSEIRRHTDMGGLSIGSIPISNYYEEQIYQLAQYIQEAAHREQTLEKKLNNLSQLIIDTQEASDSSWKVILNQDRLMEKLEMLQEQVEIHSKGEEQDTLAIELRRVLEQRYGLERESKSLLERLIQEKAEVLQRVVDLERSLEASEEECSQLRSAFEILQQEHGKISSKVLAGKDEVKALQKRLQEAQHEYSTEMSLLSADKETLLNRYAQLCEEANNLRSRLENMKLDVTEGHPNNQIESKETGQLRDLLNESSERQVGLSSSVKGLQSQLSKALISEITNLQNLSRIEDSMADSESNLDVFLMGTTSDLALHFIKSYRQIRDGMDLITLLKDEVNRLQKSLAVNSSMETSLVELKDLLEKMSDYQTKTKSMFTDIPDRILCTFVEHSEVDPINKDYQSLSDQMELDDNSALEDFDKLIQAHTENIDSTGTTHRSNILTQTDSIDLVNSEVQSNMEIHTHSAHVQTVTPYASIDLDSVTSLESELQTCLSRLESEKKTTDSLKMELIQIQSEKLEFENRFNSLTNDYSELKSDLFSVREFLLISSQEQLDDSKNDLEIRRETMQRVSASEYGQLYQESQQLRIQIQEIEEEMVIKRKEYDTLYEQYEAVLTGEKLPQVHSKSVNDKIQELEQLCSKQQEEIEEMRESMNEQYQTILTRSRRISAISSVPLCVLMLAIIICILSFLARPWISVRERR